MVRPSRALIGAAVFTVSLATVFAIGLLEASHGLREVNPVGVLFATAFLSMFLAVAVLATRTYVGGSMRLKKALSVVASVGDRGEVFLSQPLRVTPGRLVIVHWRSSSGRRTYIRWEFRGAGATTTVHRLEWSGVDRSSAVVGHGLRYAVALPAYRVEDPCCSGVYFALVDPEASHCFSEASLSVCSRDGDCASARVECSPPGGVRAEVVFSPAAGRARAARLELRARITASDFTITGVRVVAVSRGGPVAASTSLALPSERKVLLLADKASSTHTVYRELGGVEVEGFAGIALEPVYAAKLVLDIPLASDVVSETVLEKRVPAG